MAKPDAWPGDPRLKAYEDGYRAGVADTLEQLRVRFNLSLLRDLEAFVREVQARLDSDVMVP
jgi:hypothetical protein